MAREAYANSILRDAYDDYEIHVHLAVEVWQKAMQMRLRPAFARSDNLDVVVSLEKFTLMTLEEYKEYLLAGLESREPKESDDPTKPHLEREVVITIVRRDGASSLLTSINWNKGKVTCRRSLNGKRPTEYDARKSLWTRRFLTWLHRVMLATKFCDCVHHCLSQRTAAVDEEEEEEEGWERYDLGDHDSEGEGGNESVGIELPWV